VLETAESFWKLVSKDFPNLKISHGKYTRCLETHTCVRVHFVRWSKSNL